MKIFFVAILIAVAAAAQVTLHDLAISHVALGSKFTSMTDELRSEATKKLAEDWWEVFRYELLLHYVEDITYGICLLYYFCINLSTIAACLTSDNSLHLDSTSQFPEEIYHAVQP